MNYLTYYACAGTADVVPQRQENAAKVHLYVLQTQDAQLTAVSCYLLSGSCVLFFLIFCQIQPIISR